MKNLFKYSVFIFFILFFHCKLYAERIPTDIKTSVKVSDKAKSIVSKMKIEDLIYDRYFLDRLKEILKRADLNDEDKIEAFYLMLKKIRWSFFGIVVIPPNRNYFMTYTGFIATYLDYQKELTELNYNIENLLKIAERDYKNDVVHASHALLLAVLLNPKNASEKIYDFINIAKIKSAQVPDILLHHICICSVLTKRPDIVQKLSYLLDENLTEEGTEDVLCSMGIYNSKFFLEKIINYLKGKMKKNYDLTYETALVILKNKLGENNLEKILKNELKNNLLLMKIYSNLKKNNFITSLDFKGRCFYKSWDNFNLIIYEDGILVKYGNSFQDVFDR